MGTTNVIVIRSHATVISGLLGIPVAIAFFLPSVMEHQPIFAVIGAGFAVVSYRSLCVRLILDSDGIRIVDYLGNVTLPWSEVQDIHISTSKCLEIQSTDGRLHTSNAVLHYNADQPGGDSKFAQVLNAWYEAADPFESNLSWMAPQRPPS